MCPHQHGNACIGPASASKHGPLGQGSDQTYGDESDEASIEGKSNHNRAQLSFRRFFTFGDFERTEDDNEREKRSDFRHCHRQ